MKNTTQLKLTKRLTQYGALSVSILGVSEISGQNGYYDVDPDFGGPDQTYDVRMNQSNGDMDIHFQIQHESSLPYMAINLGSYSNSVMGIKITNPVNVNYVSALDLNQVIGPSPVNSWMNDNGTISFYNCAYASSFPNSQWCGLTEDKYIGVRFKIQSTGNFHYGWIRISKSETPEGNWLIKDHGYNPTPGASIMAGEQMTLTEREVAFNKARIIGLNKSIGLYNTPNSLSYSVFDMTGKMVLNGQLEGRTNTIEANTLSSGIYVIDLIDNKTKARLRKKLQL